MQQTQATATITGIDISVYLTSDVARSVAFYRDVLGMKPTSKSEQGAEFELADGSTFGVWRPDDGKPGVTVMLAVDDLRTAVPEFRSRGAVLSDVTETGVCLMSFGQDPDGNAIILHQRKEGAAAHV